MWGWPVLSTIIYSHLVFKLGRRKLEVYLIHILLSWCKTEQVFGNLVCHIVLSFHKELIMSQCYLGTVSSVPYF